MHLIEIAAILSFLIAISVGILTNIKASSKRIKKEKTEDINLKLISARKIKKNCFIVIGLIVLLAPITFIIIENAIFRELYFAAIFLLMSLTVPGLVYSYRINSAVKSELNERIKNG